MIIDTRRGSMEAAGSSGCGGELGNGVTSASEDIVWDQIIQYFNREIRKHIVSLINQVTFNKLPLSATLPAVVGEIIEDNAESILFEKFRLDTRQACIVSDALNKLIEENIAKNVDIITDGLLGSGQSKTAIDMLFDRPEQLPIS